MFDRVEEYNQRCNCTNYGQLNLMNELRKLWEQHVMWTRSFIISAVDDLGDLDLVTKRLLRNPTDFEKVLAIYYGKEKADQFRILFEDHLKIAGEIVMFAKNGDTKAVEQYSKLWYANADAIAAFLASINPFWDEGEWKNLLYDHLRMTTEEVVTRLKKEYAQNIMLYDMIQEEAMVMADVMSSGIIRQFKI